MYTTTPRDFAAEQDALAARIRRANTAALVATGFGLLLTPWLLAALVLYLTR